MPPEYRIVRKQLLLQRKVCLLRFLVSCRLLILPLFLAGFILPLPAHAQPDITVKQQIHAQDILDLLSGGAESIVLDNYEILDSLELSNQRIEIPIFITRSTFAADVNFSGTNFTNTAMFGGTTFTSDTFFADVTFNDANFSNAHFESRVDFTRAHFVKAAFIQTLFKSDAIFQSAEFTGEADFLQAQFGGLAVFANTIFSGSQTDFTNTTFLNDADFSNVQFSGASFDLAYFAGNAIFSKTIFTGDGSFFKVTSAKQMSFRSAQFSAALNLQQTNIDTLILAGARFNQPGLKLIDANFSHVIVYDDFDFASLQLPTETESVKATDVITMLEQLERTLRAQGDILAANDIAYEYHVYYRDHQTLEQLRLLEKLLLDGVFGYFLKPGRVLAWSLGIILAFALLYLRSNAIRDRYEATQTQASEQSLTRRLTGLPYARPHEFTTLISQNGWRSLPLRLWVAVSFSFSVFTRIGIGNRVSTQHKYWLILEWFLGYLMMVLLLYTLSNSIAILGTLVKSIF